MMAASSKSEKDKSKAADKKVFDVAKPGKSAPDPTTRPVIVGHKPLVQDPMVNSGEEVDPETGEAKPVKQAIPARSAKKILPLSEQKPEETENAAPDEAGQEDISISEESALKETVAETPESQEVQPDRPGTDESAAVDALANEAVKKKDGELSAEEKKRAELINKLIE